MAEGTGMTAAPLIPHPLSAIQHLTEEAWPLAAGLGPVNAQPTAARLSRTFTGVVLGGWGLSAVADVSELIVGEFAANVICASDGSAEIRTHDDGGWMPSLWLCLVSDRTRLRVEVWDNLPASYGVPVPRIAAPNEESGRGLELVEALSLDWGWERLPGHAGIKRVWAFLGT